MKILICIAAFLLTFNTIIYSQSEIDFEAGTDLTLEPDADLTADVININGSYSGGGTINGSPAYVLNLTVYLEGFYNSASDNMVIDTVIVYLRNTFSPYAIVDSYKAALNENGTGIFIFSNAANGMNYYMVLNHRNSIETWSAAGQSFNSFSMLYDFSNASSKAFGNNMIQVNTSPVRFAIYSGDVNQDGYADLPDASLVENDSYNFASGYLNTDLTGDGFADASDAMIIDNNSYNYVSVMRP